MKPYNLTKVDVKEREYAFDLAKDLKYTNEVYVSNGVVGVSHYVGGVGLPKLADRSFKYVFYELNTVYAVLDDYFLYKVENNTLVKISNHIFSAKPKIRGIKNDRQKGLIVLTESRSFLIFKNELNEYEQREIDLPYTTVCEIYMDRFFYAVDNVLYYGKQIIQSDFEECLLPFGQVVLDPDGGSICGIFYKNNKIYLICEKRIYQLETDDECEIFSVTRLQTKDLNVNKKTLANLPYFVVFMSDNRLYTFDGKTLKELNTFFNNITVSIEGQAGCKENVYMLPFSCQYLNGGFIYLYDFNLNSQTFTDIYYYISEKGGYIVRGKGATLASIIYDTSTGAVRKSTCGIDWDFGTKKNKILTELSLYTRTNGSVEITSDLGKNSFPITTGQNVIKCSITSTKFLIKIISNTNKYEIEDVKAKYIIVGE